MTVKTFPAAILPNGDIVCGHCGLVLETPHVHAAPTPKPAPVAAAKPPIGYVGTTGGRHVPNTQGG